MHERIKYLNEILTKKMEWEKFYTNLYDEIPVSNDLN